MPEFERGYHAGKMAQGLATPSLCNMASGRAVPLRGLRHHGHGVKCRLLRGPAPCTGSGLSTPYGPLRKGVVP